jgi:hypothetical protein
MSGAFDQIATLVLPIGIWLLVVGALFDRNTCGAACALGIWALGMTWLFCIALEGTP